MKINLSLSLLLMLSLAMNSYAQDKKTQMKYVYGYSQDIRNACLGIYLERKQQDSSTMYFMNFRLDISAEEHKQDILLPKNSMLCFTLKNGEKQYLSLNRVESMIEKDRQINNPFISFTQDNYATLLTLVVSPKELKELSTAPFRDIKLPYKKITGKQDTLIFSHPSLTSSRKFIQQQVDEILLN